ncbi:MAG: hypothetical protein HC924_18970, partial [Synechococcaceae cyanobacterium SM2_3_2]|nr:hypothetical protein [Synechococcaceae cyanobacterium SM2_3_2]
CGRGSPVSQRSGLCAAGAAVMVREGEGAASTVQQLGLKWLQDPDLLAEKRRLMQGMATPDAAAQVADLLRSLIRAA